MDDNKSQYLTNIEEALKTCSEDFERMRSLAKVVEVGHGPKHDNSSYQTLRAKFGVQHIGYLRVYLEVLATRLYTKNPEIEFVRSKRIAHQVWDGNIDTLRDSYQSVEEAVMVGMPPDPQALAIIEEVNTLKQVDQQIETQGETLSLLVKSYFDDPVVAFQQRFNSLLPVISTHGLGWIMPLYIDEEIDYHSFDLPESKIQINRRIEAANKKLEKELPGSKAYDQLIKKIELMQGSLDYCKNDVNKTLHFLFLSGDELIIDPACTNIKTLQGANWIAARQVVTPEQLHNYYPYLDPEKIACSGRNRHNLSYALPDTHLGRRNKKAVVELYHVFDRETKTYSVVSPQYKAEYVVEPKHQRFYLPNFFPAIAFSWRDPLASDELYPQSDVEFAYSSQIEANMLKTAYIASVLLNIPRYIARKGALEREDKINLSRFDPLGVVELSAQAFNALKVDELLKPLQVGSPDERALNPNIAAAQMNKLVGVSEASYGVVSEESATAIAQAAEGAEGLFSYKRAQLDECLSDLVRITGAILIQMAPIAEVIRRVGVGAKWFTPDTLDFNSELYLKVKAGTSGKRDANEMLGRIERVVNFLIQVPGFNPEVFMRAIAEYLEMDEEELYTAGAPSLVAMNAMAQKAVTVNEVAAGAQGGAGKPSDASRDTNRGGQNPTTAETQELARV